MRFPWIISIFIFIASLSNVQAEEAFRYKGEFETALESFFLERNDFFYRRKDEQLIFKGEVELILQPSSWFSVYARPRFLIDALNDDLKRFEPFEAHATVVGQYADLRVGQVVENWGIADTVNPVDVMNRRDFGANFFDPERLGEFAVRLRLFAPDLGPIGEPNLSFYALPVFRQVDFAPEMARYSFSSATTQFRKDLALKPDGFEQGLYAFRLTNTLSTSIASADAQVVFSRGPERFPILLIQPVPGAQTNLIPFYFGAYTLGSGMSIAPESDWLADFTFKFELAYKWLYQHQGSPLLFPPNQFPEDYFAYVVGIDYVKDQILTKKDQVTLLLEYAGEAFANDSTSQLRPFRSDLITSILWEFNDFSRSTIEGRVIFDVKSHEVILEGIVSRQLRFIAEDLKGMINVKRFILDNQQANIFSLFPNNSSVTVSLRYSF